MIEEHARVMRTDGAYVEVLAERHSACGGCSVKSGCGTSLIADWFSKRPLRFRLLNAVDAAPGDQVVIGLDEGALQRGSLLLYALPLLGLLVGALAGESVFPRSEAYGELGTVTMSLSGLAVALLIVRRITHRDAQRGSGGVRLLRVVRNSASQAIPVNFPGEGPGSP